MIRGKEQTINGYLRDADAPVSDAIPEPDSIDELGQQVIDTLNAECPEANWIASLLVACPALTLLRDE